MPIEGKVEGVCAKNSFIVVAAEEDETLENPCLPAPKCEADKFHIVASARVSESARNTSITVSITVTSEWLRPSIGGWIAHHATAWVPRVIQLSCGPGAATAKDLRPRHLIERLW
jgi:hypothetical protein